MSTFADKVIEFNKKISFRGKLPEGIHIMNPFKENPAILPISAQFYKTYYNDNDQRYLILGINPGRLGAGATGIPFTDTKRLKQICNIDLEGIHTHEPSSVFVYEMIEAFGGAENFYKKFYINSVSPLGFTWPGKSGKQVNCNYYDSKELEAAVLPFIKKSIRQNIAIGCHTDVCFCMGSGKNFKFLDKLNKTEKFFDKVIPMDHPRFIMQYRNKRKQEYMDDYLQKFAQADFKP